jgi:hypothetical protein
VRRQPEEFKRLIENVSIQVLDGYNWVSLSLVANDSQRVNLEMVAVKRRYPDRRVRAVTQDGKLIDIL